VAAKREADAAHYARVRREAEPLWGRQDVERAVERMAEEISRDLAGADPLAVCVLVGGLVVFGPLVTRLSFPCELSYLHATRYRNTTRGHDLTWAAPVHGGVRDRVVLVVDDILDEGNTLAGIEHALREEGATRVVKAALVRKRRSAAPATDADYVGLEVPDRYVFGWGMDYHGRFRNLDAIYAVASDV
jgi:hypoxanthine phosphoribosyltransferase